MLAIDACESNFSLEGIKYQVNDFEYGVFKSLGLILSMMIEMKCSDWIWKNGTAEVPQEKRVKAPSWTRYEFYDVSSEQVR